MREYSQKLLIYYLNNEKNIQINNSNNIKILQEIMI